MGPHVILPELDGIIMVMSEPLAPPMSEPPAPPKHTTDEEIAAYTVGEVAPHDDVILVVDYDPSWPGLFEREAERIRGALGSGVVKLEHVGSTSVPGLAAKPRIDMLLVVEDSSDESSYVPVLEAAGYVLRIREPDWFEHRVLKGREVDLNLHVFSAGCVEIERMVRFRDWLRTHASDRALYERTKRELAARRWKHVQNYADAKTEVVEEILGRAMGALGQDDARRDVADPWWDLHRGAYFGRVDVVRRLLASGADPNEHHARDAGWVCGPTPLNKAIVAWRVTAEHVEVVRMLLGAGARVEPHHIDDHRADSTGSLLDAEILALLEGQGG